MRRGHVYYNEILAGTISEEEGGMYIFKYEDSYYTNSTLPSISVTISKANQIHKCKGLFPFFYNIK